VEYPTFSSANGEGRKQHANRSGQCRRGHTATVVAVAAVVVMRRARKRRALLLVGDIYEYFWIWKIRRKRSLIGPQLAPKLDADVIKEKGK